MGTRLLVAIALASLFAFAGVMIYGGMVNVLSARAAARMADPAEYCTSVGGTVSIRSAVTDSAATTGLGEPQVFCTFTGTAGTDTADTTITIGGVTLSTTNPTRATMAYREKPQIPAIDPPADGSMIPNPSSIYCESLGGSEGEWVDFAAAADAPARSVTMCVFPDLSMIDSWGLTYHTQGTIRGADLDPLLNWKP